MRLTSKKLFSLLSLMVVASMLLAGCTVVTSPTGAPAAAPVG